MDGKSINLTDEKLAQLRDLLPEVFSEEKVDFARLKDILGENVVFPNEHYELSWAGKAEARKEIQKQTTNTLIANKEGSIDFENAQNLFIEGENLEVLRILQKSYFGKVKMIYIDPPYNTGNDSFVYPDDYAERLEDYKKRAGITDEEGYLNKQDLWRKNTRENGQFHSVWLSMMYPRLYLARNLLREDGVIFVSIDGNEIHNLRLILDEIFGNENFIAQITWEKGRKNDSTYFSDSVEYVIVFAKNIPALAKLGNWREKKPSLELILEKYTSLREKYGEDHNKIEREMLAFYHGLDKTEPAKKLSHFYRSDNRGLFFGADISSASTSIPDYEIFHPVTKKPVKKPSRGWGATEPVMIERIKDDRVLFGEDETTIPLKKSYLFEVDSIVKTPVIYKDGRAASLILKDIFGKSIFENPKDHLVLSEFFAYAENDKDYIVLDFFAGSSTTAHALLELNEGDGGNRKFICVQIPETLEEKTTAYKEGYRSISDISKARITKVIEQLKKTRSEQLALESKPQILGFRSFKIAPSNFKNWRGDAEGEELIRQLELLKQSEREGSLHENMLVELLLKSGLPLTSKVETLKAGKAEAYLVEDGKLFLFFGGYNKSIKELIHEKAPKRVVCLDSAFNGKDEDISNFKLELKEAGIELSIL